MPSTVLPDSGGHTAHSAALWIPLDLGEESVEQRALYVIIAVLAALVVALTGSLVSVVDGGRPTVAFRTGGVAFAAALTLILGVMASLGVVGP